MVEPKGEHMWLRTGLPGRWATTLAALGLLFSAQVAAATSCNRTTELMAQACARDSEDDNFTALAICANFKDAGEQERCTRQAARDLSSGQAECGAQERARARLCGEVGQEPYDPLIRPADFVARVTNPYFPLRPGTRWVYRSPDSETRVSVTDKTRRILGVKCTVVRDTVFVDGKVEEDTYDYFAQDREGNVWYFGEATAEYVDGLVTSVDGSFIAGEEGAKPGIIMPAHPAPGVTLRQEVAFGEAEDAARYESLGGRIKVPAGTYRQILKTFESTALEPTAREHKYYAPGVGLVLTVNLENGERDRLISIER